MSDSNEREEHYYYPGGVPVSPQARRVGFEMPVYVSHTVWANQCIWKGSQLIGTNTDRRIVELITAVWEGMLKRLAADRADEGFVWFPFKFWYWPATAQMVNRKPPKKKRIRLGARLFLDPITDEPWLYVFDTNKDDGSELEKADTKENSDG